MKTIYSLFFLLVVLSVDKVLCQDYSNNFIFSNSIYELHVIKGDKGNKIKVCGTLLSQEAESLTQHSNALDLSETETLTAAANETVEQTTPQNCMTSSINLFENFTFKEFQLCIIDILSGNFTTDTKEELLSNNELLENISPLYNHINNQELHSKIKQLSAQDDLAGEITVFQDIPLYYAENHDLTEENDIGALALDSARTKKKKDRKKSRTTYKPTFKNYEASPYTLKLENVHFRISDNFIDNITVEGEIYKQNKTTGETINLQNKAYDLSLMSYDKQSLLFFIEDTNFQLVMKFEDLFSYLPSKEGNSFSYWVKDKEFNIKPGQTETLHKRGLNEYFGINILTDFRSFNKEQNGFLQTEFNFKVPLLLKRTQRLHWFPYMNTSANIIVLDKPDEAQTAAEIHYDVDDSVYFINSFDILNYNDLTAGFDLSVISVEFKSANTNLHLSTGFKYLRSAMYLDNGADKSEISHNNSYYWNIKPYFEVKPDLKFGALFYTSFNWLHLSHTRYNGNLIHSSNGNYKHDNSSEIKYNNVQYGKDRFFFNVGADFFYHLSDNKYSGLFARLNVYLQQIEKVNKGLGDSFNMLPQIMFGYSTNIDTYVNSIRKE